jgi:hypothetical protein
MLLLPFMIALLLPPPAPIALDLKETALLDAIDLVARTSGIPMTFSTDVLAMSPSLPLVSVQALDAMPLEIVDAILAETGLARIDAAGGIVIVRRPSVGAAAIASSSRSAAVPQVSVASASVATSTERPAAATTSRPSGPEPGPLQLQAAPASDMDAGAVSVADPRRADSTVKAKSSSLQPVRVRVVVHERHFAAAR